MRYQSRIIDAELDELLGLPAVAIEGPKGVGKTSTAERRARTMLRLDDPHDRELLAADPQRLETSAQPVLLDEWQRMPQAWDLVRRSVDRDPSPGRFILTGSAGPAMPPTHSGAGRIVRLRMRPLSLAERSLGMSPSVRLTDLLRGGTAIAGESPLALRDYVAEILGSGMPAVRPLSPRLQRRQINGYLKRVVDTDLPEAGRMIRRPETLGRWLTAYAAATATTTSYDAIMRAATPGEHGKPAKTTTITWRETLERIWMLDPVPAWLPGGRNQLRQLGASPKHHLADPAFAAALLNADGGTLLDGSTVGPPIPRRGTLLGALFESLVTLSVRTYAQANDIEQVRHLRTRDGTHEVDLIIEGGSPPRVVALAVKLAPQVDDDDVRHLHWLRDRIGDHLADAAVITTGAVAYRRRDGIAVIPAALLGP